MRDRPNPEYTPFMREEDDDRNDDRLPCERGADCEEGDDCPSKQNRDAFRFALGTLVEGLEAIATVQVVSQEFWGSCSDKDCTFEAQMQDHFSTAGKALGTAFVSLLDGVQMWKALPRDWAAPEYEAALHAVQILRTLNQEAVRQAAARAAGSPDPRRPSLTPRSN